MKNLVSFLIYLFLALLAFATKCGVDNPMVIVPPTVSVSNFTPTIDENPTDGQIIGTLEASTNEGSITFSLTNQMPPGSFAIGASSGDLTVADASLFDFETNPVLTATVTAVNGTASDNATITVTLNDVDETIGLMDFTATIDENPSDNQVLGTISATNTEPPLTFSLSDQTPPGAFAISASSGELTVADASLFDFESRELLTANVTATNSSATETASIAVSLNNIVENTEPVTVSISDFTATISENPTNGQVLGLLSATTSDGSLTFALSAESPAGAFAINAGTREITVLDSSLFDFERNPVLTATVTAENETVSQTATITVNLTNVDEGGGAVTVSVSDFTATIDENPTNGQVLGLLAATTSEGSLTFALSGESPAGAFAINAGTREITVLDNSLFYKYVSLKLCTFSARLSVDTQI